MTREMAVLEIPVISIYQAELLEVDKYLVKKGVMHINPKITYEEIRIFLQNILKTKKEWMVLQEGEKSYSLITEQINSLKYE